MGKGSSHSPVYRVKGDGNLVILAQGDEASRRHSAEEFPFSGTTFCSRVIRVSSEIGEKKRITAGLLGATDWFHSHDTPSICASVLGSSHFKIHGFSEALSS